MLHYLAVLVQITFGRPYRAKAFDNEQAVILTVKFHLVYGTPRNDEIIAVFKFDIAEAAFQCAGTNVNEYYLISLAVLVKIIGHGFTRRGQRKKQNTKNQHKQTAFQIVVLWWNIKSYETGMR